MKIKKHLNLSLICMVLCLSVILCGCALTVNQVKKNPTAQVLSAFENTFESIKENSLPFRIPEDLDDSGELSVTLSNPENSGQFVNLGASWKAEGNLFNAFFKNESDGAEGMSVGVYLDGESVAIESGSLLGGTYGVNLKTLKEDLKDSALLSVMGISYDELMEQMSDFFDSLKKSREDNVQTFTQFMSDIRGVIEKVETEVTEETVTTGGEDAKAICVNYKVTKENLIEFLNVVKDFEEKTSADTSAQELIDTLEAEDEINADIKFAINPDEKVIMQISVKPEGDDELIIDLGKDPAKSAQYKASAGGDELILDRVDEDGKYSRKITVNDETGSNTVTFVYDKSTNKFTAASEGMDTETASVSGTIEPSDGMLKLTFSVDNVDVEAVLKNSASPESVPEYKNIVKLSEDELNGLLTPFISMLGMMGGNGYTGDGYYGDIVDDYSYPEFDADADYDGDGDAGDDDDFDAYLDQSYNEFDFTDDETV